MSRKKNTNLVAILVAAGRGLRCVNSANHAPKQFCQLAGHPMYLWPFMTLIEHPDIEMVVLVTLSDKVSEVAAVVTGFADRKDVSVIAGGVTRQESVWEGLQCLNNIVSKDCLVIVHDAVRPFLTRQVLDDTISELRTYGACTTCIPVSDTLKRVCNDFVVETIEREELVLVQTPQGARFDWLYEAHRMARENGIATTDDAALLETLGHKVRAVGGSPYNIKVTVPEDLILSEAFARLLFGGATFQPRDLANSFTITSWTGDMRC